MHNTAHNELATLEMLAPLYAVLDPAYPATMREIAEQLFLQLLEESISESVTILAQTALKQTNRLGAEFGGANLYLHKMTYFQSTVRNRELCALYAQGWSYRKLAKKYDLTDGQVRNITEAWRREQFAKRQGNLEF